MGKFTKTFEEFKSNVREESINEAELSQKQKDYAELMKAALAKFDAKSPADLDEEGKKEMFNWIKKNWDKEKGEASEEGKELVSKMKK